MKKVTLVILGTIFSLTLLAGAALAAEKFAYVDLSRLFAEYGKTKDYDKVLNEKEGTYSSEREKKVNELKQIQDKMDLLNEKEKAAKKTELEGKVKTFQDSDKQKQMDLRKEQDEKMKEILKDIEDAVKKYSEGEGITMVFNDRVLVYQNKALDITDKVMEILNKSYPAKKQ